MINIFITIDMYLSFYVPFISYPDPPMCIGVGSFPVLYVGSLIFSNVPMCRKLIGIWITSAC